MSPKVPGRLGDHLLLFIKAAWFAQQNKLQLLYSPFEYSDDLALSSLIEPYDPQKHIFDQIITIKRKTDTMILQDKTKSTLFVVSYRKPQYDENNLEFREYIQKLISPKQPLQKIEIPEQHLSVAIHIRTGGNFTSDTSKFSKFPLKFAPLDFFVDQLNYVITLHPDRDLYVYLFTDDQDPEKIINVFKTILPNNRINYGFRPAQENQHKNNVLEDLFSMMDFDVLIRPDSGFSNIAGYLGRQILIIKPTKHEKIYPGTWYIKEAEVMRRERTGCVISTEKVSYIR